MSERCSCGLIGTHPEPEPRHVQCRRDKISYRVYQSSFTRRFADAMGWTGKPRQGEVASSTLDAIYQFQGERWVMVWGEATDPDPTDPGSPWPAPVPAITVPDDTWVQGDPARDLWMERLFPEGTP